MPPKIMNQALAKEYTRLQSEIIKEEKAGNIDQALVLANKLVKVSELTQHDDLSRFYLLRAVLHQKLGDKVAYARDVNLASDCARNKKIEQWTRFALDSVDVGGQEFVDYTKEEFEADVKQAATIAYVASEHYLMEEYEQALIVAKTALAIFQLPQAMLLIFRSLIKLEKYEVAINEMNRLLNHKLVNDFDELRFYLAIAEAMLGNAEQARQHFLFGMWRSVGSASFDVVEVDEILDAWRRNEIATQVFALSSESNSTIGKINTDKPISLHIQDESGFAYSYMKFHNQDAEKWPQLVAMMQSDKVEDVDNLREQIIKSHKDNQINSLLYFRLAKALQAQGRADDAIKEYTTAIWLCQDMAKDPDNKKFLVFYYQARRAAFFETGHFDPATSDLNKVGNLISQFSHDQVHEAQVRLKDDYNFISQCLIYSPTSAPAEALKLYGYAIEMLGGLFPNNPHFKSDPEFDKCRDPNKPISDARSHIHLMLTKITKGLSRHTNINEFAAILDLLHERKSEYGPLLSSVEDAKEVKAKRVKHKPKATVSSTTKSLLSDEVKSIIAKEKKEFAAWLSADRKQMRENEEKEKDSLKKAFELFENERKENQKEKIRRMQALAILRRKKRDEAKKQASALAARERLKQDERRVQLEQGVVDRVQETKSTKSNENNLTRHIDLNKMRKTAHAKKQTIMSPEEIKSQSVWFKKSIPAKPDIEQHPSGKSTMAIRLTPNEINILNLILEQQHKQRQLSSDKALTFLFGDIPRSRYANLSIPTGLAVLTDATEGEVLDAFNTSDFELDAVDEFYYGQRFIYYSRSTREFIKIIRGKALIDLNASAESRMVAQMQMLPFSVDGLCAFVTGELKAPLPETLEDIHHKFLRSIVNPWALYACDPVYILQTLYYADCLGLEKLDECFENAFIEYAPYLQLPNTNFASATNWLSKLFSSPNALKHFDTLCRLGVMDELFPLMGGSIMADMAWVKKQVSEPHMTQHIVFMSMLVSAAAQNLLYGQTIEQAIQFYISINPIFQINFSNLLSNQNLGTDVYLKLQANVIERWQADHPAIRTVYMPVPYVAGCSVYPITLMGGGYSQPPSTVTDVKQVNSIKLS